MSDSAKKAPKDPNAESIPIYFYSASKSNKDVLIGKVQLKEDKNTFKVIPKPNPVQGIKEYTLKNEENQYLQYTGRETVQDSNYILMKFNTKDNEFIMYPANKWVNFFRSFKLKENKENLDQKAKEKEKKEQLKRKKKMLDSHFNFNTEIYEEDKKKQKRQKRPGLMSNNEETDIFKPEPAQKKILKEFKEDSHSSENDIDLADDSYESEEERKKKEDKKRKEEEEERKKKEKKEDKKEENEEEEEEEDEDKDINADVEDEDDDLFLKQYDSYANLIGKKRERENNPSYDMEEKLENILRKKSKMTEDEIISELSKEFKKDVIEKYFETILDKITNNFIEKDEEKNYYLKK